MHKNLDRSHYSKGNLPNRCSERCLLRDPIRYADFCEARRGIQLRCLSPQAISCNPFRHYPLHRVQDLLDVPVRTFGPPQHEIVVERMVPSPGQFPLPELVYSLRFVLAGVEEGGRAAAADEDKGEDEEGELQPVRFPRALYCSSALHLEGDCEPRC